ncbi:MAG: glycoside hydrolase family 32 protein [Roseivirga sp.]|uniref:glycoside hydrolase family 32 protein n=1 Tax=Roseivirga sp. TaxID=1964215 RepID=UPI001B272F03|nr:glycoside hydrolase family 32 protein [Roseivirga sp.]MBO6659513.1 glycoside hydrolase family 32 protein [Roseivirga sp.]MBO6907750.1 glycoside hydrolase family 32 protein [Roseivirga sp.]
MKKLSLLLLTILMLSSCNQEKQKKEQQEELSFPDDKFRSQIHFTPKEAWMNDPNGMVYYDGEYHLFYQYYPDSTVWGPMHWGHAVSPDMVHWEHLPIALYPDELGYIFSGSAVVDWNNTSGFQTGEHPPMIAIFTHHEPVGAEEEGNNTYQYQSIAYSNDKGRTWTKYEGNPVVPNPGIKDFRDPKVIWLEDSQQWLMVFAALDRVKFYTSPNLIDWKFQSDFGMNDGSHGGVWECPDLFQLQVEGSEEKKWVLLLSINPGGPNGGSATQYFVGDFDGKTFTNSQDPNASQWLDHGPDNYAGVTWSDIPEEDGRRLFLGWMGNWNYAQVVPTEKWRSAMTIPRSLHLTKNQTSGVYTVASRPVNELASLHTKSVDFEKESVNAGTRFSLMNTDDLGLTVPFKSEFTVNTSGRQSNFRLVLDNPKTQEEFVFRFQDGTLYGNRAKSGLTDFADNFAHQEATAPFQQLLKEKELKVEFFVDESSIEIFLNDGSVVMTEVFFPTEGFTRAYLISDDNPLEINSARTTQLKSIW